MTEPTQHDPDSSGCHEPAISVVDDDLRGGVNAPGGELSREHIGLWEGPAAGDPIDDLSRQVVAEICAQGARDVGFVIDACAPGLVIE